MTYCEKLRARMAKVGSGLCVGLDPRPDLIPGGAAKVADWLKVVIEQTAPHAACYKPNSAYFEALGVEGFRILTELRGLIPNDIPLLLDAKRSDIGETQAYYAKAAFEVIQADAVTLNPFLGFDSIEPFLPYQNKCLYLLAVTSNPGAADLETQRLADGSEVFERVFQMAQRRAHSDAEIGFVVGLTNAADHILSKTPDVPLLVPGLGAQGGDLRVLRREKRAAPLLVNVSRGILYADPGKSFAEKAQQFAAAIRSV